MSETGGILYVVATPIGNLGDISSRALEVLGAAELILAEDTRRSKTLMQHYGIAKPLMSLHEHNERGRIPELLKKLSGGADLALISDAGTPLLSDPGYLLINAARTAGITVSPIPGASAITAALSAAGLPTHRFIFEGFLPAKRQARQQTLKKIAEHDCTTVIFESSHRILETLTDIKTIMDEQRSLVIARELTKRHETFIKGSAMELLNILTTQTEQQRGEFVLLLEGAARVETDDDALEKCLQILLETLPVKESATLAAKLTGATRNTAYRAALNLSQKNDTT